MQKNTYFFIVLLCCLALLNSSFAQDNKLINGEIDLTQTHWENHLVKLEGQSDFYWHEFLIPESPEDSLSGHKKYSAPIPKPWTKVLLSENQYAPANGYGTYRFKIKVANTTQVYGLKLRSIFTAYELYVNGQLLSRLGSLGKTKEESKPQFLSQEIALPVIEQDGVEYQTLDIVLHVSNFHHRRAGAQQPILFGTMTEIIDSTANTLILNLFLIGIIVIIGLNHILMYALRRLDIGNMLFGLLSIIMVLRNLSTEERVLTHWFPNMSWELLVRLDNFSGFGTMSFFALYFYFAYKKSFPKVIFYILTGIGIAITILVFSSEAWFYGQFKMIFEAYIGLGGLYLVFGVLLRASFQKQKGAIISFIGMFLLYTTAVNDLLHSMGVINTVYIAPYGIAAFMVLQSFLLTKKSAIALLDNQKLSIELNEEKQMLENRIEERTQELSNQANELKSYQKEQEQQNWINLGLNEITEVMRQNKDNLTQLADQLLSTLVKRIDATLGAMYLHSKVNNEEHLKLLAHYGLNQDAQHEILNIKEGLTGQCYSLSKELYIDEIPEKYFSVSSGLGSSNPRVLALIPMKIDQLAIGVIELAAFKPINQTAKEFLRRATENIASQLNIVKMNEEAQNIIADSRRLEQEAKSKNREMRETLEEMQAIQEEQEFRDKENQKLLEESMKIKQETELQLQNALDEIKKLKKDVIPKSKP